MGSFFEVLGNIGLRTAHIPVDIPWIRQQNDHGSGFRSFFEQEYFFHCLSIGGIASDAPDRIRWVKNNAPLPQDLQAMQNIIFKFQRNVLGKNTE